MFRADWHVRSSTYLMTSFHASQIKDMLVERKETLKYTQELQERADTLEAREEERYDQMKKKQQLELKTMKDLHRAQTKQLGELLAPPPGFVVPSK